MTHSQNTPTPEDREDFWLEIGPPSAYIGLDAYETARREGDASPDGKKKGFTGAEPRNTAVLPETENSLDDIPPMDR